MLIRLNNFMGSRPRADAQLLAEAEAQIAQNANLLTGKLEATRGNTLVQAAIANALSIYLLKDTWLEWTTVVNVCPSPIVDTDNRVYFTGTDVPRVTTYTDATTGVGTPPINSYKLGIPAPADGITADPVVVSGNVTSYDDGYATNNTNTINFTADGTNPVHVAATAAAAGGLTEQTVTLTIQRDGVTIATQDFTFNSVTGQTFTIDTDDNPAAGAHTYTISCSNPPPTPVYSISTEKTSLDIALDSAALVSAGDTIEIGTGFNNISYTVVSVNVNTVTVDNTTAQRPDSSNIYPFNPTKWTLVFDQTTLETRFYVCTFVADVGNVQEEGPPCNPSKSINVGPGQSVTLSNLPAIPAGYNINTLRIYRTNPTANNTAAFQFVMDIAAPLPLSKVDSVIDENLGEVLPTAAYSPPPDDMAGLKFLAGGVLAGFSGNTFCPSVPYQPHAYPDAYRITTQFPIMAILPFGSESAAILTTGRPILITGTDPSVYEQQTLDEGYPCLSGRAAVEMPYGGVYPSEFGLVLISLSGTELLTRDLYTPEQWAALAPNNMIAGRKGDRYVCFHSAGGIMIDPKEPNSRHTTLDFTATAIWTNPETEDLYLVVGGNIVLFDADDVNLRTYTWKSKQFLSAPETMQALFIDGDFTTDIRVALYADGVLKSTKAYGAAGIYRLPSGYRASKWEVQITGTTRVDQVILGGSVDEIQESFSMIEQRQLMKELWYGS